MKKHSFEDALILTAVKAARAITRRLSESAVSGLAGAVGLVVYGVSKRRVVAYRNLRAAFPEREPGELRHIARRSARSLALSFFELLRAPEMDAAYGQEHVAVVGREHLEAAFGKGKGVIFLSGHFGNWEMLGLAGGFFGYPIVALARVQKHPKSDEYLNRIRSSNGAQIIRKGIAVREVVRALREGKIVGMVGDQDGGKKGVFVDFFGRSASTATGAATFALRTGATILPIFIFREQGLKHRIEIEPPLQPLAGVSEEEVERDLLQRYAKILEEKIRKSPEQWLWAHRRWKSSPDRHLLVLSDGKAGHLNQSLEIARSVRDERAQNGFEATFTRTIEVRYRSPLRERVFRSLDWITRGFLPFRRNLTAWALEPASWREIRSVYADVVLSTGASIAGVNLAVAALNGARSVVCMKPPLSASRFDAVIAPRHDSLRPSERIFLTDRALSSPGETALLEAAERARAVYALNGSEPKLGLLVGGDTDRVSFEPAALESFLASLVRATEPSRARILATTSRRTPDWAESLVESILGASGRCPLLVLANRSNPPGTVTAILALSDALVVSSESMSMVSEAVSCGKPVFTFLPGDERGLKPKYREFLDRMRREGLVTEATAENVSAFFARPGATDPACPAGRRAERLDRDRQTLRAAARKVMG